MNHTDTYEKIPEILLREVLLDTLIVPIFAFRYAKGSSTIQLADVEALYVSNMAGRGRQKKDKKRNPLVSGLIYLVALHVKKLLLKEKFH